MSKSIVQCGSPCGTGTPTSVTLDAQMWGSTNPTMSLLAAEKARPNGMRTACVKQLRGEDAPPRLRHASVCAVVRSADRHPRPCICCAIGSIIPLFRPVGGGGIIPLVISPSWLATPVSGVSTSCTCEGPPSREGTDG